MNITNLKKSLSYLLDVDLVPLIVGDFGEGKSTVVRDYAREHGLEFIDLRLSLLEPGDLIGLPDLSSGYTRFCPPEWLPRSGKGILFLDELNRASRPVLQAIFQLVLDRRIHEYKLPEGWRVVAAMNPSSDGYIVNDLADSALRSRFVHIKLDTSLDEYKKYSGNSISAEFLSGYPDLFKSPTDFDPYAGLKPSARSWAMVDRLLSSGIQDNSLIFELVSGIVGVAAATSFCSWLESRESIPDAKKLLSGDKDSLLVIERASNSGRMDIVNAATDAVISLLKSDSGVDTAGLKEFLKTLPLDVFYKAVKALPEHYSNSLGKDRVLIQSLTDKLRSTI